MKRLLPSLVILIQSICIIHSGYAAAAAHQSSPDAASPDAATTPAAVQANCGAAGAAPCGHASPLSIQANATVMAAADAQQTITGYYNVRSFGALGIGTDDETAAVQSAINAGCKTSAEHPRAGVTLYFPAGNYPVHGLQISCGNLLLEGAGPGTTDLQYDGPQNSGTYPVTPSTSAYIVAYTRGMANGGLQDMTLVGYTAGMQPIAGVATDLLVIEGELDSQALFQNLGFAQVIHDGIHLITPAPAFNPVTMGGANGYTTSNNVPATGGSGTGMRVSITAADGRATSVMIVSQGDGYQIGDKLTVDQPGSSRDAAFVLGARSTYVNWFMRQIRWDGIGRYCIHMDGMVPASGQPFALYGFTWANPINTIVSAWLAAHGYLAGPWVMGITPWSEGLIGFTGDMGYMAAIYDGRLEGTEPQIPVGPGREGNLFVSEMPQQPSIHLHLSGSSVSSVEVTSGGYGWTANRYSAIYRGCTRNPSIDWIISNDVVVGGTVTNGGVCSVGASVTLFLSGGSAFTAQNVVGFISSIYSVPLIYSASGQDSFKLDNVRVSAEMGDYMNGRTGALSIAGVLTSSDRLSYGQTQTGWSSQGHSFLSVPQNQISSEGASVRAGDIIFHDASDFQKRPFGQIGAYQIITYPVNGYTMLRPRTNLCGGTLTPSGNTWSGCTPNQLRAAQVSVGAALTFPSVGSSTGGLDTYVMAVDWSTGVITTAAAATGPSTVNYTAPQWRDSWATAASYPTSPDTIYYQGEVIYNSAPAPGRPIWWSCMTRTCTGGSGWIDGPAYGAEHAR
jgi:hypothetical protein